MELDAALRLLGLGPATDAATARATYRQLLRDVHPDLGDPDEVEHRTRRTAALTAAWAVVEPALAGGAMPPPPATEPDDPAAPTATSRPPAADPQGAARHASGGDGEDGTLWIDAPADEAFALLHDGAGRIGQIAYVDRHLGLLEVVVRFAGGPSCSVLTTLQGRASGTDVLCTMTSIEAAPTPAIGPVLDALAEAVAAAAAEVG